MAPWLQILLAFLGSSAVFTFITFLINRHDSKKANLNEIKKSINTLNDKFDKKCKDDEEASILACRRRIIDFAAQINRVSEQDLRACKSGEQWKYIMADLDKYEKHVAEGFPNGEATWSIDIIKNAYKNLFE